MSPITPPVDPGPAAWNAILLPQPAAQLLDGDRFVDWLVVGAGFAGLAAARRLKQHCPDDSIAVVDARRVAEGPAGRNSGFMIDLPHNLVSDDYAGALEADRTQTEMNRMAIDFAASAAEEYDLPTDTFLRSGKINAAATSKGERHNLDYARHLARLHEEHEILDAAQMKSLCGSSYYLNGLYTPGTAMLQPASFIRGMADGLSRAGVDLYENSPVTEFSQRAGSWTATTPNGAIHAPKMILTVNGHIERFGYFQRRLMHVFLYASMTRALSDHELTQLGGEATWGFTPADPMGTTVRKFKNADGTRILIRNGVRWSPSLSADLNNLEKFRRAHDRSFNARFPMLAGVEMQYRWGGLLCLSRNGTGAFGELDTGLYSACCQNGLGAARGTLSGMMVADLACGHASPVLETFRKQDLPQRLPPEPFATIGARAVLKWNEFRARREL